MSVTTFVRLLGAIRDHLAICELVGSLASIQACSDYRDGGRVTVQLGGWHVAEVARGLVSWAVTLSLPAGRLWRVPGGESVHLEVCGRLADEIAVKVYGSVGFDPERFGVDLEPGERRDISLGVLRIWAAA